MIGWLRRKARGVDRWCGKAIVLICIFGIPFVPGPHR